MKRVTYESLAALTAISGAAVLVGGLLPWINPGFFEFRFGERDGSEIGAALFGATIAMAFFGIAFWCNRKAKASSKAETEDRTK